MPTIRRCCIVGCLSNSRQNPQLQFFQFPRPENPFHKLWKQACHASLSRILPFKKPVVCALHFRPNCIGGRRLTSSAVPSLHLDVPHDLKAVEQQAMIEEIERSRKCAYINAVVYEWLVRANLNPQLRGSITHGMIKEKAEESRRIIGSTTFVADNRWLNRFRETHLTGFAQKLAANQLKPVGSSLWIPDIVQDLTHMFPPTSTDRLNFESVPEQYYDYMQQRYGEYEEDEEELKPSLGYQQQGGNPYIQNELKPSHYHPHHHQQSQQSHVLGHHQQAHPTQPPVPHGYGGGYEPYGHIPYGGGYDDYYSYQQQQQHQLQQQQQYQQQHHHTQQAHSQPHQQQHHMDYQHHTPPPPTSISSEVKNTPTHSQTHSQPPSRPPSQSPHPSQSSTPLPQQDDSSQTGAVATSSKHADDDAENPAPASKRARYDNADEAPSDDESNDAGEQQQRSNGNRSEASRRSSSSENEAASENTTSNGNENGNAMDKDDEPSSPTTSLGHHNGHAIRPIQLPKAPISQSKTNGNGNSPSAMNGHAAISPTTTSTKDGRTNGANDQEHNAINSKRIELQTYAQALEYLRPLEDFVLLKENFRAIGIISHLECVLRKASNRAILPDNPIEEQL